MRNDLGVPGMESTLFSQQIDFYAKYLNFSYLQLLHKYSKIFNPKKIIVLDQDLPLDFV